MHYSEDQLHTRREPETAADQAHARRVAVDCVKRAKQLWGPGWRHLTPMMQRAFVAREVVAVVQAQMHQYEHTLQYLQTVAAHTYKLISLED